MRILWHSHSPLVTTGYGTPTALWLPRLSQMGHEVVASAFYGQVQEIFSYHGIPVMDTNDGKQGSTVLCDIADSSNSEMIITLMDTWSLIPETLRGRRVINWFPVDTYPLSALDEQYFRTSGGFPVAMSRYGQEMLHAAGFRGSWLPYAFDPAVFYPDEQDRTALREKYDLDGKFAVGINASNVDRKAWAEQLTAYSRLWNSHPGEVILLANTNLRGSQLTAITYRLGLPPEAVRWSISGLMDEQALAHWYRMLDVLSACSYAEGFCLPVAEAQACGTPVIVTDHPPVSTEAGLLGRHVACEPAWNSMHQAWWQRPSVKALHEALEEAFAERKRDPAIVSYITENYSVDAVTPLWAEIFEQEGCA